MALLAAVAAASERRDDDVASIVALLLGQGRQRARQQGAASVQDEQESLRGLGYLTTLLPLAVGLSLYDRRRATYGGNVFARGYRRAVDEALDEGLTPGAARRAARRKRAWHLRTLAATESAEAFGYERERQARQLASLNPGLVPARQWVAMLDACPVCNGYDGEIVGIDEAFSGGRPGSVHPNCRCFDAIVMVAPSEIGFAA